MEIGPQNQSKILTSYEFYDLIGIILVIGIFMIMYFRTASNKLTRDFATLYQQYQETAQQNEAFKKELVSFIC